MESASRAAASHQRGHRDQRQFAAAGEESSGDQETPANVQQARDRDRQELDHHWGGQDRLEQGSWHAVRLM